MNFVPELPPLTEAQKTQVVIGAMLAMFLAALDQTILAPALPLIVGASEDQPKPSQAAKLNGARHATAEAE